MVPPKSRDAPGKGASDGGGRQGGPKGSAKDGSPALSKGSARAAARAAADSARAAEAAEKAAAASVVSAVRPPGESAKAGGQRGERRRADPRMGDKGIGKKGCMDGPKGGKDSANGGKDGKKGKDGFTGGKDGSNNEKERRSHFDGKGKGNGDGNRLASGSATIQDVEVSAPAAAAAAAAAREKNALEAKGEYCEVRKHTDIGCAVVRFESAAVKQAVFSAGELLPAKADVSGVDERRELKINGTPVQLRLHFDKRTQKEVVDTLFVAWGRQAEKQSPLPAVTMAEFFDGIWHKVIQQTRPEAEAPVASVSAAGGSIFDFMNPATFSDYMAQGIPGLNPSAQSFSPTLMTPQPITHPPVNLHAAAAAAAQAAALAIAAGSHGAAGPGAAYAGIGQSAIAAYDGAFATPPRLSPASFAEPISGGLRADAPEFTPPPLPIADDDSLAAFDALFALETKMYPIVDPSSGEVVAPTKVFEPISPDRKAMAIKDPTNGNVLEVLGLNFKPPDQRPFSIVDPSSGASIKL